MKMKKILLIIVFVFFIGAFAYLGIKDYSNSSKTINLTDSEKFKKEYSSVSKNNIFVYKNADEIIKILENGTGIVYLGFPECPWCLSYVPMLNDIAKSHGIKKIYYFNIKDDRANNTKEYQTIVKILKDYLDYDDEGNKRIYVPEVVFLLNGKILGSDNETANGMTSDDKPNIYWTEEKKLELNNRLSSLIDQITSNTCTSCE